MPKVNGCRLDQHQSVYQLQPHHPVRRAKAPMRTSEHSRLMAQRKNLEQQVSMRREGESDRADRSDDATHSAYDGQSLYQGQMVFASAAILARHRSQKLTARASGGSLPNRMLDRRRSI